MTSRRFSNAVSVPVFLKCLPAFLLAFLLCQVVTHACGRIHTSYITAHNRSLNLSAFSGSRRRILQLSDSKNIQAEGGMLIDSYHISPKKYNKASAVPKKFYLSKENCNPQPYSFIINQEDKCTDREVFMLVLIRTIYEHHDRRNAIRSTWGLSNDSLPYSPILFLFGKSVDSKTQSLIEVEAQKYGDVLQANFRDSYTNLYTKDVMAFRWAYEYCPYATHVMIGSDEILVDMFKLIPYLIHKAPEPKARLFSFCHLYPCCTKVYREGYKYTVSEDDYPGTAFPSYCSGTVYIAPSIVIHELYKMSFDTPPFMPDDAWIGVMAEKLGISFTDTYDSFVGIRNIPTVLKAFQDPNYVESPVIVAVLDYDFPGMESAMMLQLWESVVTAHAAESMRRKLSFTLNKTHRYSLLTIFSAIIIVSLLCLKLSSRFKKGTIYLCTRLAHSLGIR